MTRAYEDGAEGEYAACSACPTLGDQAEALLTASSVWEINEAAKRLRLTAISVSRLLTRPSSSETFLQFDPSVRDPEQRRMDLADLAVEVVTAVDYLLSLQDPSVTTSPPFILAGESGLDIGRNFPGDRLTRRRLDARGAAVRLGMRLLGRLSCDVAFQSLDSSSVDRESPGRAAACLLCKVSSAEG